MPACTAACAVGWHRERAHFKSLRCRELVGLSDDTQRLQCSSFLVMTYLWLRHDNLLPKDKLHSSLWVYSEIRGEELRDRKVVKPLRSVLLEDPYGGHTVRALSWRQGSYNDAHCMHPMLDLTPHGSKGPIWLGSIKASSSSTRIRWLLAASVASRKTDSNKRGDPG